MTEQLKGVDDSVLRKIQKCLALATSSEPGEAEAAMRQAQKLMAMHGVTDSKLARAEINHKSIQGTRGINPTPWEMVLAQMCCRAFGAKLLWAKGPKGGQGNADNGWWTFVAPKSNVELVVYTFTVLSRQVIKARTKFVSDMPILLGAIVYSWTRARKAAEADAYCESFVGQLSRKISDAMLDPKVAEALSAYHKEMITGGEVKAKNNGQGSEWAAFAGMEDGQKVSFHNAANGPEKLKQLGSS